MWPDNETDIDLLGFEYLVDSLQTVLTNPALLPITVGVMGDWGSGKTSLMSMTARRLSTNDKYIVVPFSPWRYEGHDDVKTALMATVVSRLVTRAQRDPTRWEKVRKLLPALAADLRSLGRVVPAVGTLAGLATGGAALPLMGTASVAGEALAALLEAAGTADAATPLPVTMTDFRGHFRDLLNDLDDVDAVVVVVDDLDRCLPETIVSTFEAIKLFLHAPRTAYVLAAHPLIVEAAVAARYADSTAGDANLGRDYLEKIVQVTITVPPLSEPEVESYINLLFAYLHLESGQFELIRAEAGKQRKAGQFEVTMNYAVAAAVLGDGMPDELQNAFVLASHIAPTLARGLRGNPRQVKRFLNTLILRRETARQRGVELDDTVLAKLMILELSLLDFERVFRWQLAQDGQPTELVVAEALARGEVIGDAEETLVTWASSAHINAWLQLDPPLAGRALGSYFFFSRDRLSTAAPASRLPGELLETLAELQHTVVALRRAAVARAANLDLARAALLFTALSERAVRDPAGPAMESAVELAGQMPVLASSLASALGQIPARAVPPALPARLVIALAPMPAETAAIIDGWEKNGPPRLKTAVREARK
jgi:hypothetical protein